jgi:hypothetical protein
MLGTGIKNGILLLLIIMIFHFLIKNAVLERQRTNEPIVSEGPNEGGLETVADAQHDELYKYVMDGDTKEEFDEGCKPREKPQPSPETLDTTYPIACDATQVMQPKHDLKKKEKHPEQVNDFLVIHEYRDENPLNGGKLFDGLQGYDAYDAAYQDYKCGQ